MCCPTTWELKMFFSILHMIELYNFLGYWKILDKRNYYSFAGIRYWSLLVLSDKICDDHSRSINSPFIRMTGFVYTHKSSSAISSCQSFPCWSVVFISRMSGISNMGFLWAWPLVLLQRGPPRTCCLYGLRQHVAETHIYLGNDKALVFSRP